MADNRERLDKAVSSRTNFSRKDVHNLAARGLLLVNGLAVRDCAVKVGENDYVVADGQKLQMAQYSYLMLNKPRGVVCATADAALPTVIDLIPQELRREGLFPAGRLDKETEGFVLITNDGELSHKILSPKSHVPKTYLFGLDEPFNSEIIDVFKKGVMLRPQRPREGDKKLQCLPAILTSEGNDYTRGRVILRQGLYHQVRRMFAAFGLEVISLQREKIGGLTLDSTLEFGECRPLLPQELLKLYDET